MPDAPRLLAGRYRLDTVIGSGGMGQVWRGTDETLGRQVAVKEVRLPTQLDDEQRAALCERMLREARLTARLSHPGVVTVYDVVSDDNRPFIVMELLHAPSLADEITSAGSLPAERVAAIGLALLDALGVAHAEGIVHRDVKPGNVLLAYDRVVLTDFGIAISESDPRMTATGLLIGSPTYMSPERLRGQPTGPAADLWSLGATLYAAVEGRPPFDADTTMGTVSAVLTDDLPSPAVGGALREALVGMLNKDPAQRIGVERAGALLRRAAAESAEESPGEPEARGAPAVSLPWAEPPPVGTRELRAGDDRPDPAPPWGPSTESTPESTLGTAGRPRRSGRMVAVGSVLVAGLVVLAAVVVLGGGQDEPSSAGAPSPSRTADGSTTGSTTGPTTGPTTAEDPEPDDSQTPDPGRAGGSAVPEGFRVREDPLGFRVAVPAGWQRSLDGPTRVDFVAPDGAGFLRVDQVAEAGASAEQAWLDAEEAVAAKLPGYERVGIETVDYRSYDTADWEFVWESDSGPVHVLNRGIATDTRGFALYVSTPESQWENVGLAVFDAAADSFQPVE